MRYMVALMLVATCVAGFSYEDARDALLNATLDVEQASREGLPHDSLYDALVLMNQSIMGSDPERMLATARALNESDEARPLAQKYFDMLEQSRLTGLRPGQNFTFVIETGRWIGDRKRLAFDAREQIALMENELAGLDEQLNLSTVNFLMGSARSAYESERFERVPGLVNESRLALDSAKVAAARERALLALFKRTFFGFISTHWLGFLFFAAFIVILGVWAFFELRVVYALRKIRWLRRETDVANEMLLNAQRDYYNGAIGRTTYKNRLEQQRDTMRKVKSELDGWNMLYENYKNKSLLMRLSARTK